MPPKGRKKGANAPTPGPAGSTGHSTSSRNLTPSSSSGSEAEEQPVPSPFEIPAWLTENSAVHVLNPDIRPTPVRPKSPASRPHAYLAPPIDSSNQSGPIDQQAADNLSVPILASAIAADAPPQAQSHRRRSTSSERALSSLQQNEPFAALQGQLLSSRSSAEDILRALRSTHSPEILQQLKAAIARSDVITIVDNSPPKVHPSETSEPASGQTADTYGDGSNHGGGTKRLQPGNPSTSSSSVASSDNATPAATTLAAPVPTSASSTVLSPRRKSVVTRCPVCLLMSEQWPEGHNPLHCVYVHGPRSALEGQQLDQLHATRRLLQSMGSEDRVNYAGLDSSSTSHSPSSSDYLPLAPGLESRFTHPHRGVGGGDGGQLLASVPHESAPRNELATRQEQSRPMDDPRIKAVRDAERAAYAAGVDNIRSSEERSQDTPLASRTSSECSSSEYQPSSLGRSSSTGGSEPKWLASFRQTQESAMASMRSELSTLMAQVTQLAQTQVHLQHEVRRHHAVPPLPFPVQSGPYMPYPGIPFMPPFQPAAPHVPHAQDDFQQDSVPPLTHNHRVNFADMVGVNSPSMMHTARPRSGMQGAPDLAPEDIGNVVKFNEFLKQYSQYAAKARDMGSTWSTVAGLLARYAEDLAIAFTACAMKRGNAQLTQLIVSCSYQTLNLRNFMLKHAFRPSNSRVKC